MPVFRFAGCLAGFFVPVCVAGAVLCACFYGLTGAGCRCVSWVCVRLSVCLWCLRCACGVCVAGFALCGAVSVCRCCAVVCALMLRCGAVGVLLSIKTRVYSDFRMHWIIWDYLILLCTHSLFGLSDYVPMHFLIMSIMIM